MKIVFYENRYGGFIDKVIRWKTATWKQRFDGTWRDLPSHVELLFSDGMMFSASQYENSTRFKKHSLTGKAWDRIDLKIDRITEQKIRNWCIKQDGKKYDYVGILGFMFPYINDNHNRWFCSEICFEALKQNTNQFAEFKDIDSAKVSPAYLKRIVSQVCKD